MIYLIVIYIGIILSLKVFKVQIFKYLYFFIGGASVYFSIFLYSYYFGFNTNGLGIFEETVFFAFMEEFGKILVLYILNKYMHIVQNAYYAVIAMIFIALGFSFFENIYYVVSMNTGGELFVNIYRGVVSTLSHILFSIVAGYFFIVGFFNRFRIADLKISRRNKILKILKNFSFLRLNTISQLIKLKMIAFGIILSTMLHSYYNYLLIDGKVGQGVIFIILIFLVFLWFIRRKRKKNKSNKYLDLHNKIERLRRN